MLVDFLDNGDDMLALFDASYAGPGTTRVHHSTVWSVVLNKELCERSPTQADIVFV
jgi:hypothetical protein